MSKNNQNKTRKLKIEAQINSLFDDMEESQEISTLSIDSSLPGWEWHCDLDGIYTKCGSAIQTYLGIDAKEPIGEKLSSFSVAATSILPIENILASNRFPADVFAQYLTQKAEMITVHIKIYQIFDESGESLGLHGFSQIINLTDQRSITTDEVLSPTTFNEPKINPSNPLMQHIYHNTPETQPQKPSFENTGLFTKSLDEKVFDDRSAFDTLLSSFFDDKKDIDIELLIEKIQKNQGTEVLLAMIDEDPNRLWSDEEILVVEQVAEQLSMALENAELFQQTQTALASSDEQSRRLELLNDMSTRISQITDPVIVNQIATEIAKNVFNADHVSVLVPTENETILRSLLSIGEIAVIRQDGMITKNDFENNACLTAEQNISILHKKDSYGETIHSLMSGHVHLFNETSCVINIGLFEENGFTQDDQTIFQQIINLLVSSYQNRNLMTEIGYALNSAEEQSRRLILLNELADSLGQSNEFDEISETLAEKLMGVFTPTQVKVCLLNFGTEELIVYTNLGEIPLPEKGSVQHRNLGVQQVLLNNNMNQTTSVEFDKKPFYSTINAPILSENKVIGVVIINDYEMDKFNQADINILSQMLSLVSSTFENINLFTQIQRRSDQLQTTAEVSQRTSRTLDVDELIKESLNLIQTGFKYIHSSIYLVQENSSPLSVVLHTQINKTDNVLSIPQFIQIKSDEFLSQVEKTLEPLAYTCVENDTLLYQHPQALSLLILPLTSLETLSGFLIVQTDQTKTWQIEDITTLSTLSDQLSSSIDNARLYLIAQQKAEQEKVIREITETLSRSSSYEGIMHNTLEELEKITKASKVVIHIGTKEHLLRFKKPESGLPSIHIKD